MPLNRIWLAASRTRRTLMLAPSAPSVPLTPPQGPVAAMNLTLAAQHEFDPREVWIAITVNTLTQP